jgi:hypothetical protein
MKRILINVLLLLSISPAYALNPYGFEQIVHIGHVFARSIVYDESTGLPLWAEYNDQGGHTKFNVDLELANNGRIVSGQNYRAYQAAYTEFATRYDNQVEIYTTEEFKAKINSGGFTTKDGQPIQNWDLNRLGPDVLSVAIPSQEKRLQYNANQIEKLYFPVDLKTHASVGPGITSVLIDATGVILKASEQRIGKLSAFYTKKGEEVADTTEYNSAKTLTSLYPNKYDILDPIEGIQIEGITGYVNGVTVSGSDGFYNLKALPSPCPGFSYFPELTATARLYYSNFNPKGYPAIPYYIEKKSYNGCIGYGANTQTPSSFLHVIATISATPENITRLNYPVAINVLAGNALIVGAAISDTEPTEYFADQSPMTDTIVHNDYDGDGQIDGAQRGDYNEEGIFILNADADKYGVYLTGSPREDNQPNFTRVIDTLKDVQHKGLVKVINKTELMQTDILVFRESTGQLITERSGLSESDLKHSKVIGRLQQDGNGNFSYTIAIRSTEDTAASKRKMINLQWQDWQAASQMNPELHAHKSDFIRNGEQLRIVAINRATGYIGTQIQELTGPKDGGDVTVPVKPIIMNPPNLKVWATRSYQPSGALSGADKRRNTISNEGAASTDDYVIEIHSNWLDENGFPLPAGLKDRGYTGRLVKVSIDPATTNDPYDTQITEFPIDPGKALQVLKFGEGEVGKYHYYLQVNGKTGAESNDFSTGNHTGVLRHRPNKYVPVKVPLFDESLTNVNKILQLQNNPDAKGTDSAFDWVYRPELSFSVVDLEVSSILLHSNDPEDDPLELINSTDPVISTADSAVEIFYNLLSSQFDRITPLDGEQTFILAFGEEEIEITVNSDGTPIKFTNLEHLAEIKPEDYMSIRLYLNEDSQNVLWDWAFTTMDLDMDSDNNNGYEEPDRTVKEEETEKQEGHPGKIIRLNDGDINQNDIPDFAEFEYIDSKGIKLNKKLVPFVVEIPGHVEIEEATIKFEYTGSDPLNIAQAPDPTDDTKVIYTPAEGSQRLWLKNADEKRNPLGISEGGDYVTPNAEYTLLQLGFENSKRIKILYIEGIRATEAGAATTRVYLEYQP